MICKSTVHFQHNNRHACQLGRVETGVGVLQRKEKAIFLITGTLASKLIFKESGYYSTGFGSGECKGR